MSTTLEFLLAGQTLEESLASAAKKMSNVNSFAASHVYRVNKDGPFTTTQLYPKRRVKKTVITRAKSEK